MFGIAISILSSALDEIASSIGKHEIKNGVGSIYTFGFLAVFFGTLYFIILGFLRGSFYLDPASLPLYLTRVVIETAQMHLLMQAMVRSDRGDVGFFRLLTIPFVFMIDLTLGIFYTQPQLFGMGVIVLCIGALALFEKRAWRKMGRLLLLSVMGAVTISIFRYDITKYNSIEAEQSIIGLVIALYFFIMAAWKKKEDPLSFLKVRAYSVQAAISGISEVIAAFAFLFAPAAIITAAFRLSALFFSILSGRLYFHEKHFKTRVVLMCAIGLGLYLII